MNKSETLEAVYKLGCPVYPSVGPAGHSGFDTCAYCHSIIDWGGKHNPKCIWLKVEEHFK